ncbi:MAG: hypothetical protein JWR07_1798 [Nevskia sp.]|nr:hypothetical protein [Nevskia sp.]
MRPNDRDPPEGEAQEPRRQRGASPVVQPVRSKIGIVAGCIGICLVVVFLFMTGGHKPKTKREAEVPVLSANNTPPPALPDVPSDSSASPFEVPNNQQHFESGHSEAADAEKQKAEARRHSPMLVYDDSGHGEAGTPPKPSSDNPFASLIAAQLQNSQQPAQGASAEEHKQDRSSPAEGYAERTQAFAQTAADHGTPEAVARRITMDNRVAEGKMIPAILETAVSSDLPGKLRAIISQDVWSEDGSRKLIRRGSRLAGEYRSGLVRGQTRVFVIWTRVLEPDGLDVAIGSPGTDDIGRSGMTGDIDRHFVERFGAAFLLSLIGSATTASQGGNTFVVNTSQGFGQVAQDSLQDSINIPPTIYVDQGTPVQVFVARDLVFGPPETAEAALR